MQKYDRHRCLCSGMWDKYSISAHFFSDRVRVSFFRGICELSQPEVGQESVTPDARTYGTVVMFI